MDSLDVALWLWFAGHGRNIEQMESEFGEDSLRGGGPRGGMWKYYQQCWIFDKESVELLYQHFGGFIKFDWSQWKE